MIEEYEIKLDGKVVATTYFPTLHRWFGWPAKFGRKDWDKEIEQKVAEHNRKPDFKLCKKHFRVFGRLMFIDYSTDEFWWLPKIRQHKSANEVGWLNISIGWTKEFWCPKAEAIT